MQLNLSTDYAIRILIYMGEREGRHTLAQISEEMNIPRQYIATIVRKLKRAGLMDSIAGVNGGHFLLKTLAEITLFDVMRIMETTTYCNRCLEPDAYCDLGHAKSCPVRKYYIQVQKDVEERWLKVSLADIVNGMALTQEVLK